MGPINPTSTHVVCDPLQEERAPFTPGIGTAITAGGLSYLTTAHLEAISFRQIVKTTSAPSLMHLLRKNPLFPFSNGALPLALGMSVFRSLTQIITMSEAEKRIKDAMPSYPIVVKTAAAMFSGAVQAALTIAPTSIYQQIKLAQTEDRITSVLKILQAIPRNNRAQFLFGNYGLVALRDSLYSGIFYPTTSVINERLSTGRDDVSLSSKFGFGILSAACAGGLAVPLTQPFQVALTHAKITKISGNCEAIRDIVKKYGLRGLFAGLTVALPKLLISAVTVGAVMTTADILHSAAWTESLRTETTQEDAVERERIAEHHFNRSLESQIPYQLTSRPLE